jgi:nucleotide-binding universal stress UspA family protein
MTTETGSPRSTEQQWQFETPMIGGLVVGFDGSPASSAALDTAELIAAGKRWPVHVVSVLPAMSSYKLELGNGRPASETDELRLQLRDAALRDAIGPDAARAAWTHQTVIGDAQERLVDIADKRAADLIVLGRSQRGGLNRLVTGETTLNVARHASVPVLVVDEGMAKPLIAVAAVDFGPACARAARMAIKLLGKSGTLYLVYAEEPIDLIPDATIAPVVEHYPGEVVVLFRRLIEDLRPPAGVVVEPVILNGAPVPVIEEFCERIGAEILVTGTHGLSRAACFFLGSVSTGLVRRAQIPVLVAPAPD